MFLVKLAKFKNISKFYSLPLYAALPPKILALRVCQRKYAVFAYMTLPTAATDVRLLLHALHQTQSIFAHSFVQFAVYQHTRAHHTSPTGSQVSLYCLHH